jgi:ubiquinone/menaquinone biosynthesis C-methylase UbiE
MACISICRREICANSLFVDQTFDLVYEFYSLVHLSHADIATTSVKMNRVLKPGGLCFAGFMSAGT